MNSKILISILCQSQIFLKCRCVNQDTGKIHHDVQYKKYLRRFSEVKSETKKPQIESESTIQEPRALAKKKFLDNKKHNIDDTIASQILSKDFDQITSFDLIQNKNQKCKEILAEQIKADELKKANSEKKTTARRLLTKLNSQQVNKFSERMLLSTNVGDKKKDGTEGEKKKVEETNGQKGKKDEAKDEKTEKKKQGKGNKGNKKKKQKKKKIDKRGIWEKNISELTKREKKYLSTACNFITEKLKLEGTFISNDHLKRSVNSKKKYDNNIIKKIKESLTYESVNLRKIAVDKRNICFIDGIGKVTFPEKLFPKNYKDLKTLKYYVNNYLFPIFCNKETEPLAKWVVRLHIKNLKHSKLTQEQMKGPYNPMLYLTKNAREKNISLMITIFHKFYIKLIYKFGYYKAKSVFTPYVNFEYMSKSMYKRKKIFFKKTNGLNLAAFHTLKAFFRAHRKIRPSPTVKKSTSTDGDQTRNMPYFYQKSYAIYCLAELKPFNRLYFFIRTGWTTYIIKRLHDIMSQFGPRPTREEKLNNIRLCRKQLRTINEDYVTTFYDYTKFYMQSRKANGHNFNWKKDMARVFKWLVSNPHLAKISQGNLVDIDLAAYAKNQEDRIKSLEEIMTHNSNINFRFTDPTISEKLSINNVEEGNDNEFSDKKIAFCKCADGNKYTVGVYKKKYSAACENGFYWIKLDEKGIYVKEKSSNTVICASSNRWGDKMFEDNLYEVAALAEKQTKNTNLASYLDIHTQKWAYMDFLRKYELRKNFEKVKIYVFRFLVKIFNQKRMSEFVLQDFQKNEFIYLVIRSIVKNYTFGYVIYKGVDKNITTEFDKKMQAKYPDKINRGLNPFMEYSIRQIFMLTPIRVEEKDIHKNYSLKSLAPLRKKFHYFLFPRLFKSVDFYTDKLETMLTPYYHTPSNNGILQRIFEGDSKELCIYYLNRHCEHEGEVKLYNRFKSKQEKQGILETIKDKIKFSYHSSLYASLDTLYKRKNLIKE